MRVYIYKMWTFIESRVQRPKSSHRNIDFENFSLSKLMYRTFTPLSLVFTPHTRVTHTFAKYTYSSKKHNSVLTFYYVHMYMVYNENEDGINGVKAVSYRNEERKKGGRKVSFLSFSLESVIHISHDRRKRRFPVFHIQTCPCRYSKPNTRGHFHIHIMKIIFYLAAWGGRPFPLCR